MLILCLYYRQMCEILVVTMHVDSCTTKRDGKTYRRHLLRTSYREAGKVKKRTIANLTHCSEEEIEAIRLALQHKADLTQLGSAKGSVEVEQGLSVGTVVTAFQVAKRLGIVEALGVSRESKLALWQVLARVIDQGSRLSAVRLAMQHAACEVIGLKQGFNEDHLYHNLKWVSGQQEQIENRLFARRYGKKRPGLFLYDVTSSYLEGVCNALGAFGYNRDKKRGKQQIVIGLMSDVEGEPVTIQVFDGNTNDTKTFSPQVKKVVTRFGGGSVTFVGDRGMIKGPQIAELKQEEFHYITAITKPQIEALLGNSILQMSLFDEKLAEVELKDGTRLVLRRNPVRVREIKANRESKLSVVKREVAVQNQYLEEHPRAQVATACKNVEKKITTLKLSWTSVVAEKRCLSFQENLEEFREIEKLDGCYVIKTDLAKQLASKDVVHDRYKDLALVEQAFRTCKTAHLEVRPVYVQLEENTRAHVLIVMLAYKIVRELARCWKEFNLTVEEALHELSMICAQNVILNSSGNSFTVIPTPNSSQKKLLDAADVTLPDAIPKRNAHVVTRKSLVSERK